MTLEQITAANVTFEAIAAAANPAYHNSVDWYRTVVHELLELKRQSLVKAAQEAAASTSDSSMVPSVFFSFFCVICLMFTFELQYGRNGLECHRLTCGTCSFEGDSEGSFSPPLSSSPLSLSSLYRWFGKSTHLQPTMAASAQ